MNNVLRGDDVNRVRRFSVYAEGETEEEIERLRVSSIHDKDLSLVTRWDTNAERQDTHYLIKCHKVRPVTSTQLWSDTLFTVSVHAFTKMIEGDRPIMEIRQDYSGQMREYWYVCKKRRLVKKETFPGIQQVYDSIYNEAFRWIFMTENGREA